MITGQYRVGLWQRFCLLTSKLGGRKRVALSKNRNHLGRILVCYLQSETFGRNGAVFSVEMEQKKPYFSENKNS